MKEPLLKVEIVDSSQAEKCEGTCGMNWSLPESVSLAKERLRQKYGKTVSLQYLNLSLPEISEKTKPLAESFPTLPMPILLINGQPKIWGDFDLRMLLDMVETEMDVHHDPSI